jgi:hypothetical protein
MAVFGSILVISLFLTKTVSPCELAYPYDREGYVGVKKTTSVGLLVFNPLCLPVISLWKFAVD